MRMTTTSPILYILKISIFSSIEHVPAFHAPKGLRLWTNGMSSVARISNAIIFSLPYVLWVFRKICYCLLIRHMNLHFTACRENNASPSDSHVLRTNGTNLCLLDVMNGVLEMISFYEYCGNWLKLQCFTVVRKALSIKQMLICLVLGMETLYRKLT